MASQSQTVSLYHRTIRNPQSITKSIYGNFSADSNKKNDAVQEFVIVRGGTTLELISINTQSGVQEPPVTLCIQNTHSYIRDIQPLHFPDHSRTYIALATDTGVLTILRYNKNISEFEPIVSEMYGRSGIRRAVAGEYIAVDPYGRAVLIAGVEKQKIAYGLSTEMAESTALNAAPQRVYNVTSGVEFNSPNTVTYDLAALFTETKDNPLFVTIESNYIDVINANTGSNSEALGGGITSSILTTTNKYQPQQECKYLVLYEHEVNVGNLNKLTKVASIPLPSSAHRIIPVPITHIYPGGCVVLCENCCYYYPLTSSQALYTYTSSTQQSLHTLQAINSVHNDTLTIFPGIRCDYPIRMTNQPTNTMINTYTTYLLQTKKIHRFFIFIQTEFGDIFQLNFHTTLQKPEHKTVVRNIQLQLQEAMEQGHTYLSVTSELSTIGITNTVEEMQCVYLDSLPPATSLHLTNKGQLFATSEAADSALLQLKARDVEPTDPAYAVSTSLAYSDPTILSKFNQVIIGGEQNSGNNLFHPTSISTILEYLSEDVLNAMYFIPTPLIRLTYLVTIPTFSTLRAAAIYQPPSSSFISSRNNSMSSSLSLYTAHGSTSRSYLTMNKFGLLFNVAASTPLSATPSQLYSALTNYANPLESILCLTYLNSTEFFSLTTGVDVLLHKDLVTDQQTLTFGTVFDQENPNNSNNTLIYHEKEHPNAIYLNHAALIQVLSTKVVCLRNSNSFGDINESNIAETVSYIANSKTEWSANANLLRCAAMTNNYVVVATDLTLYVLKLSGGALLNVCSASPGTVINSINVFRDASQQQPQDSLFFCITGEDSFVRFYSLITTRDGMKDIIQTQMEYINTPRPSSILLTMATPTSGTTESTIIDASQGYYSCHIVINDYLYQYMLSKDGQFITAEPIKQYVGGNINSQIKLCPIKAPQGSGAEIVLCSTNRTPQIYHDSNWLQLTILEDTTATTAEANGDAMVDPNADEFQYNPKSTSFQEYSVLYNALHFNSPLGELILGNCDKQLLLCQYSNASSPLSNANRFYNNKDAMNIPQYVDSNGFVVTTHMQPLSYTCRGLHHVDIADLASKYKITQVPRPTAEPTPPSNEMNDVDSTSKQLVEKPFNIVDSTGTASLSKQLGSILISVEGDNHCFPSKENNNYYSECNNQQQSVLTQLGVDFENDYNISQPTFSNTKTLTGGNPVEYHTGYFHGNDYHGCVRVLDPATLNTYHVIETPTNMIVTSHCVAVMEDTTVLVVGGYRLRPAEADISLDGTVSQDQPAKLMVTTGMLATYELYYSAQSKQWAISLRHLTNTPHRVTAITPIHYNQTILVGQSDEIGVYQLGKRQLLFKSKIALRRGLVASITATQQFTVLDHTNAVNTLIYVGYHGQGYSMLRLSINKQQPIQNMAGGNAVTTQYVWNVLTNNVDSRYVTSCTPVEGGIISGDRFGNISLYGVDSDDIITLLKDPTGYDKGNINNTTSNLVTASSTTHGNYFYNENGIRLQCFSDFHLGSPVTNIFTITTPSYTPGVTTLQQCVLYTTLNGQIGILKPITSPFENEVLSKCTTYCYNQLTITGNLIRKFLSYWNPLLNVIDGDVLMKWIARLQKFHHIPQHFKPPATIYSSNPNHSLDQHYQQLINIAQEHTGGGSAENVSNTLLDLIQLIKFIDNSALR